MNGESCVVIHNLIQLPCRSMSMITSCPTPHYSAFATQAEEIHHLSLELPQAAHHAFHNLGSNST